MIKQMELVGQVEELATLAVNDVFKRMLSLDLESEAPAPLPLDPGGQIVGSVGFTGEATGVIYIFAGIGFAKIITSQMLGIELAEVDPEEMLNDAIGELSNIIVGHVKSHLCDSGHVCVLTIPSVIRGAHLRVEDSAHVTRRALGFRHGKNPLVVEILMKESKGNPS